MVGGSEPQSFVTRSNDLASPTARSLDARSQSGRGPNRFSTVTTETAPVASTTEREPVVPERRRANGTTGPEPAAALVGSE